MLKNIVFWDVTRVALVRTDVSEELSASFIRGTRIGELGTKLAVTSNRRSVRRLLVRLSSTETSVITRATRVTSQKTAFFVVTAVKTSNLTLRNVADHLSVNICTVMCVLAVGVLPNSLHIIPSSSTIPFCI
jgi:DNA-directed RNA polymerase specialized sigma54-like protein